MCDLMFRSGIKDDVAAHGSRKLVAPENAATATYSMEGEGILAELFARPLDEVVNEVVDGIEDVADGVGDFIDGIF